MDIDLHIKLWNFTVNSIENSTISKKNKNYIFNDKVSRKKN